MTETRVLSPGDAIALGDLLAAIQQKRKVRYLSKRAKAGGYTDPTTGELRSLVVGDRNYALAPFGTDVRDMHVWVTTSFGETTFSVAWGMEMLRDGGMVFE